MEERVVRIYNGEEGKMKEFVTLNFRYEDVSQIDDFVLKALRKEL